jgi:cytochrome c biogenesis protein CcdA
VPLLILIGIGFLAGVITAISPCVLPVLPIILAGSASGGRRRPYAIIGGLVVSFSFLLLAGAWLLDQLGLPQDFLGDLPSAFSSSSPPRLSSPESASSSSDRSRG